MKMRNNKKKLLFIRELTSILYLELFFNCYLFLFFKLNVEIYLRS